MSKRKGRASWWKMFYNQRATIDAISDADVGQGLKTAYAYFDGDEIDPSAISQSAFIVFCTIKPYLDEALGDYEKRVQDGKDGASERWGS